MDREGLGGINCGAILPDASPQDRAILQSRGGFSMGDETPSQSERGTREMSIHEVTSRKTNVSGDVEILLLTCMDFRMIELMRQYMTSLWLYRKYDHIVLGGASLGGVTEKYPAWNQTFWDHLRLAIDMHGIRKVMVIDHRDCGAYRAITGEDLAQDPGREKLVHVWHMRLLARQIRERYPGLEIELLLMDLHGAVERIE